MKAVFISEFGGIDKLELRDVEDPPRPTGSQVLVRVRTAALNRADLLQRRGLYPAPEGYPQQIPGLEFAGEVLECGPEATGFTTGERVFGITAGGAQAEFLLTDASLLARIPPNLDFIQAGAVPEAFITAHDAIFTLGGLTPDETLLVHAVGSGVGLAGLQLAKARGCRVFGTSRTPDKLARCADFGLDEGFATGVEGFDLGAAIKAKGGVDVVLDLVGARFFEDNVEALKLKGRTVLVGTSGGAKAELNYSKVMAKRLRIIGTVLRSRPTEEKALATRLFTEEVVPSLEKGILKPNVDRVFDAAEVKAAHELLESNATFGKVLLSF